MKNSLLPLVAAALAVALGILAIRPHGDARGAAGPEVGPGIYAQPRAATPASPFIAQVAVHGPTSSASVAWRTVVLSGLDRAPVTNACLLALAERITAEGGTVILDPAPRPPLDRMPPQALPADHRVTVATTSGAPPADPASGATVVLTVTAERLALPAGHPAAALMPVPAWSGTAELTITIPPSPGAPWSAWYAGAGREAAEAVLAALAGRGVTAPMRVSDWGSALPQPPSTDGLHWYAAVQDGGLRAWLGQFQELSQSDAEGRPVVPADLARRLGPNTMGERKWDEDPTIAAPLRGWTTNHDGLISHLTLQTATGGYALVLWQELAQAQAARALAR